jgi:hypothetical protein
LEKFAPEISASGFVILCADAVVICALQLVFVLHAGNIAAFFNPVFII